MLRVLVVLACACGGPKPPPDRDPVPLAPSRDAHAPTATTMPTPDAAPRAAKRWCPPASAVACSKDGWCWDNPRPHGMFFNEAWGDANRLVAIAERSVVAIREQGAWKLVDTGLA